tara:strand:+ start:122 stop:271 length:150 start_codon:yes stop_codon:yes gene_type:complete
MANPFVEYTDKDGVVTKLEFNDSTKGSDLNKFYEDHIKAHEEALYLKDE